jgi:3-hydroxypropanoate dehydrogenase
MSFDAPLNDAAIDQLFRKARTYNGYLNKPVSDAQLNDIWELMKFGPTSANCLPARLIWCTSTESKEKLAALAMPANGEKILLLLLSVWIWSFMNSSPNYSRTPMRAAGLSAMKP